MAEGMTGICGRKVAVRSLTIWPDSHHPVSDRIALPVMTNDMARRQDCGRRAIGQLVELTVVTVMGVLSSTLLPAPGLTAVTLSVSLPTEVILSALTPLLVSFCR